MPNWRDWQKAKTVLEEAGCVVNITEVVAIEVADRPGGLEQILEVIEKGKLNVEYMYAFTEKRGDRAVLVFRFDQPDAAIRFLQENGVNVIGAVDLYNQVEG